MEHAKADMVFGACLIALVTLLSLAGTFLLPRDYNQMNPQRRFLPPGTAHPLGTDNFGRDVFFRIMAGGKHTLIVALITVAGSALAGSALGLAAGFSGGLLDEAVMRLMDTLSAFPGILLALTTTALLGGGETALIPALLTLFIPGYTRIARSGALEYRGRDFVLLAGLTGASRPRILFVEILPNIAPNILSGVILGLSNAIMAEATMSYLGLGAQPPTPSWGRMLAESQNFLFNAPWCALSPGFFIMLTVIGFHALGEGVRRGLAGQT